MTYRLSDGTLEVETMIANMSAEPMPVSIGFHPYFQLTDSPTRRVDHFVGCAHALEADAEQASDR